MYSNKKKEGQMNNQHYRGRAARVLRNRRNLIREFPVIGSYHRGAISGIESSLVFAELDYKSKWQVEAICGMLERMTLRGEHATVHGRPRDATKAS